MFKDRFDAAPVFWLTMLVPATAWFTHVVWAIGELSSTYGATGGQMLLGALGTVVPPIGIIHGVMIWFG